MSRGVNIGELEELILLVTGVIGDGAYSVKISKELNSRINRTVSMGALHTALYRLEEKGLLTSELGEATKERGGKPKRYFMLTEKAEVVLKEVMLSRYNLWKEFDPGFLS